MEAGTNRNAQDWFRLMLDTGLAPGMRALGFTGAARRYRMAVDRQSAEVVIVQSPSLTHGRVRFTLHIRVLTRDEWSDQLRVRPYYPASTARPGWEAPIGELVYVGGHPIQDLWWELQAGKPFDTLAAEILTALRTFVLPAISHHLRRPA